MNTDLWKNAKYDMYSVCLVASPTTARDKPVGRWAAPPNDGRASGGDFCVLPMGLLTRMYTTNSNLTDGMGLGRVYAAHGITYKGAHLLV